MGGAAAGGAAAGGAAAGGAGVGGAAAGGAGVASRLSGCTGWFSGWAAGCIASSLLVETFVFFGCFRIVPGGESDMVPGVLERKTRICFFKCVEEYMYFFCVEEYMYFFYRKLEIYQIF